MSYFENADTLTIESVLDLMMDLYNDVAEGIGIEPEVCECDDGDALAENLIWMGTVFQNICRLYRSNIASSGRVNLERLATMYRDLEQEVKTLQRRKVTYENETARLVELQKKKRNLEGELSDIRQKQPELEALQYKVEQLKVEKEQVEQKWAVSRSARTQIETTITQTRGLINDLDEQIRDRSAVKAELEKTQTLRGKELLDLNAQIKSGDTEISKLNGQIEALRKDIAQSDKAGILRNLQNQQFELEQEKRAIEVCIAEIRTCEREIKEAREEKAKKNSELEKKRRDQERAQQELIQLQQNLEQFEEVLDGLSGGRGQYNKLKRRYQSLQMITEQLRKDGAILCKRTGMESFSLRDDLDRAMNAIGSYLTSVAAAIDQYSSQTENRI